MMMKTSSDRQLSVFLSLSLSLSLIGDRTRAPRRLHHRRLSGFSCSEYHMRAWFVEESGVKE